jgi:hypothetical protein
VEDRGIIFGQAHHNSRCCIVRERHSCERPHLDTLGDRPQPRRYCDRVTGRAISCWRQQAIGPASHCWYQKTSTEDWRRRRPSNLDMASQWERSGRSQNSKRRSATSSKATTQKMLHCQKWRRKRGSMLRVARVKKSTIGER